MHCYVTKVFNKQIKKKRMSLEFSLEHQMDITQSTPVTMMHRSTSKDQKYHNIPFTVVNRTNYRCKRSIYYFSSLTYSRISPGWQSSALQIASKVLKRIAFAFPVFRIERFDNVRSTLSESSFSEIFRFAIITSKFTIIGMAYTVKSFSS